MGLPPLIPPWEPRDRCPHCEREIAYLPLGRKCLVDGYLWWYRVRRWLFLNVAVFGINDPDDVVPYFEHARKLQAERARDRAGEFNDRRNWLAARRKARN